MTTPRPTDAAPDAGVNANTPGLYQPDFSAYTYRKAVNLKGAVDELTGKSEGEGGPASIDKVSVPTGITTGTRLHAEGQLLSSIPTHIGQGVVDSAKDAWAHIGRTTFETTSGLLLGAGFSLLCKNPNPIISAATTWAGRAFLTIAAVDLGSRFARPMSDTWVHLERLNQDKAVLGDNLGDAVLNYSVAIVGGITGAKLGEKYLATTKLGSVLQGFKETEISAEALGKLVAEPASAGQPLGAMARAFGRRSVNLDGAVDPLKTTGGAPEQLPIKGSMRLREMPDGSHIGSTRDGAVLVLTKDGTALYFKNNRSVFGLRNKLDLAKVLHQGGDETDVLTSMYSPTTMPTFGSRPGFIGKDPSAYFETPPSGGSAGAAGAHPHPTYTTIDGTKFVTGREGTITAVESGGNRAFIDSKGRWKLGLAASVPKGSDVFSMNLSAANFNLGSIPDRFSEMKKGAEVGISEVMLERGGDIGSSIFEHEVLVRETKAAGDHAP